MLQKEKELLQEELRHHRALGTSLEALVQDHCQPNEREKYHIFIGTGTLKWRDELLNNMMVVGWFAFYL